jgi:hypothetical protein
VSELYQADALQQLQMLKEQTRLTGALHEAQVVQLKMWPLVLFQDWSKSEFTWDPDQKYVAFKMSKGKKKTRTKAPKLADHQERVDVLAGWVQELLGSEWRVQVQFGPDTEGVLHGKRKFNVGDRKGGDTKSGSVTAGKRNSTD